MLIERQVEDLFRVSHLGNLMQMDSTPQSVLGPRCFICASPTANRAGCSCPFWCESYAQPIGGLTMAEPPQPPSVATATTERLIHSCLLSPHLSNCSSVPAPSSSAFPSSTYAPFPNEEQRQSPHSRPHRPKIQIPTISPNNGRQGIYLLRRLGAQHQEGSVCCCTR
jgi:hypothetical protein